MFGSQDSFDYNKPQKRPVNKKLYIILLVVFFVILLILGIFYLVVSKNSPPNSGASNGPDIGNEQQFIGHLADGDVDSLVEGSSIFSSRASAIETIDWMQADYELSDCKTSESPVSIDLEGIEYYQTTFSCPLKHGGGDGDTDRQRIVITSTEDEIIFIQIVTSNNQVYPVADIVKVVKND